MDFFRVLEERHSIRSFLDKKIKEKDLRRILEAANSAPSAGNLQAYEIIVIEKQKTKEKLAEAALMQEFIAEAPVVLVFVANPRRSTCKYGERGKFYSVLDAAIAAAYAQLAATALGLATCWVGAFEDEKVIEILKIPKDARVVAIMPLGYAAEKPYITKRRKLEEIVHRES